MHPMFVRLFLETDAEDLLAEQGGFAGEAGNRRRAASRAKRNRARATLKVTQRDHAPRPQR